MSFWCFFLVSQLCATGKARDFSTSRMDINYCPDNSFRQDTVIKSRHKISSCSIIKILTYFHLCFKPQDLVIEASHDHVFFFTHTQKVNGQFHKVLEICNFLIMMTELYSELGDLATIQQRNAGDAGGEEEKDEDGEKWRVFILGGLTQKECHWGQTVWHDVSNCIRNGAMANL